jgi:hypothetical protein
LHRWTPDDYRLLIVLSKFVRYFLPSKTESETNCAISLEGQAITFTLGALEAMDSHAGLKRAMCIAVHMLFFKSGAYIGRTFVCVVKTSSGRARVG